MGGERRQKPGLNQLRAKALWSLSKHSLWWAWRDYEANVFCLVNFNILLSVRARAKELAGSRAVVILTPDMRQVAEMSNRTALLCEGDPVGAGVTKRVFTKPDTPKRENHITCRFG